MRPHILRFSWMIMSKICQNLRIALGISKLTVDSSHDEANLGGIGGTGKVGVDLLRLVLV